MTTTRGNLTAARITAVAPVQDYGAKGSPPAVDCHFNPFEYTVSKSNTYDKKPKNRATAQGEFKESGAQTLKLTLYFDTYEIGEDVSKTTSQLWRFMEPTEEGDEPDKKEPPTVAFEWGGFRFVAVITNMTQKFTLFDKDGKPVRAQVDVTFTQYHDVKDYAHQNPTSGGGPPNRIWSVVRGDRLDLIAAEVYKDATQWRLIAQENNITNPFQLRPGTKLLIPQKP